LTLILSKLNERLKDIFLLSGERTLLVGWISESLLPHSWQSNQLWSSVELVGIGQPRPPAPCSRWRQLSNKYSCCCCSIFCQEIHGSGWRWDFIWGKFQLLCVLHFHFLFPSLCGLSMFKTLYSVLNTCHFLKSSKFAACFGLNWPSSSVNNCFLRRLLLFYSVMLVRPFVFRVCKQARKQRGTGTHEKQRDERAWLNKITAIFFKNNY
jgi:hypothetical protein